MIPQHVLVGGIPGSGKTSYCRWLEQEKGFLHLDFLQNNKVRINDNNSQIFGTFPRDQFFTLAVNMEITSSSATAHANLFGTGASGNSDDLGMPINVSPLFLARQFGEVKFYMGFPWNGSFDATNIIVTRK